MYSVVAEMILSLLALQVYMCTESFVLQSEFTFMHKSTNLRMYSAVIKLCGRIAPGVVFIAASLFALQIAPGMTIKAGERTPKIRSLQWVKGAFKVLPLPRSGGRSLTYAKIVWWIRNIV